MDHFTHNDGKKPFDIALLIARNAWDKNQIEKYYIWPLEARGIDGETIVTLSLKKDIKGKATAKEMREYLELHIFPALEKLDTSILLVADADYFKALTKVRKVSIHHGYSLPCKIKGQEHLKIILSVNYKALFHNPDLVKQITQSLNTLQSVCNRTYIIPGTGILTKAHYPVSLDDKLNTFKKLLKYKELTCDVETYSLELHKTDLVSIAFAWNQHEGVAFPVQSRGSKKLLKNFFENYKGKLIYHGGTFDIKMIIKDLFMKNFLDMTGMTTGLDVMFKNVGDTMLLTYLATNSTSGNKLSLKEQAQEYAGNYALDDITNLKQLQWEEILQYNLIDAISTWYVHNKHYQKVIDDKQWDIYQHLFIPGMKVVTQMELCGMPMNMPTIDKAKSKIEYEFNLQNQALQQSPEIKEFEKVLRMQRMLTDDKKLKTKKRTYAEVEHLNFNPKSPKQVGELLHDHLHLPIIDVTDKGSPTVGADVLKKHLSRLQGEFNITDEELNYVF